MPLIRGVSRNQFLTHVRPVAMRHRGRHADPGQAAIQSVQMLAQAKQPRSVDGDHLIHGVTKQKGAIEGRDPGFGERQVRSIQVADGQRAAHANHSRMVSMRRLHQPPAATGLSGCKGTVARVSLPLKICSVPIFASKPRGAISLGVTSTLVFTSDWPRASVMYKSSFIPNSAV